MDVSIIIPVYNDEDYVGKCLDSVLSQSGCKIEIICIDDGSTDGSSEILRNYAGRDSRLRVISQDNKGVSAARNRGIDEAQGRYVLFVDSDDMLAPDAVESLVRLADAENLDQVIFGVEVFRDKGAASVGDSFFEREKEYFRVKESAVFHRVCSGVELSRQLIDCESFYVSVWSRMSKRQLFTEKGLRFVEGIIHEDNLFTPLAMVNSRRATIVPDILYRRRLRGGSIMTSSRLEKRAAGLLVAAMKLRLADDVFGKYMTYLYRKIWLALSQELEKESKDRIIADVAQIMGPECAETVENVIFPLLNLVDEMHARAQKYRDKRLSSRVKRLFGRIFG